MNDTDAQANETAIDQIWLTPDSALPFWLAVTVMVGLIGAFLFWPLGAGAVFVALVLALKWATGSRTETSELPRG